MNLPSNCVIVNKGFLEKVRDYLQLNSVQNPTAEEISKRDSLHHVLASITTGLLETIGINNEFLDEVKA